jgi:hypothetical protein
VKFGRKRKLTPKQINHARKLIDKGAARQQNQELVLSSVFDLGTGVV